MTQLFIGAFLIGLCLVGIYAGPPWLIITAFLILVVLALGRFRLLYILAFVVGFITGIT